MQKTRKKNRLFRPHRPRTRRNQKHNPGQSPKTKKRHFFLPRELASAILLTVNFTVFESSSLGTIPKIIYLPTRAIERFSELFYLAFSGVAGTVLINPKDSSQLGRCAVCWCMHVYSGNHAAPLIIPLYCIFFASSYNGSYSNCFFFPNDFTTGT